MVYNSSLFLLYFLPVFLLLFYLIDPRYRNGFVVAASTFFFAWGAPVFVFILWGILNLNYFFNRWMDHQSGPARRWFLAGIVSLDLGLLLIYKYSNFFIDNLNVLMKMTGAAPVEPTGILLPLGISFITFQLLSYSIDVYRRTIPAAISFPAYASYVLMFPKLLAGPIIRYKEMAADLETPRTLIPYDERINGFFRFVTGLAKKVLIANALGETVDQIFEMNPSVMSSGLAWTGALGYAFQIYFDFSGYSDMAIGLAGMMGYRFSENFNNPYTSRSITEFWRRWHITLSSWLRDYLFLPLAYNASRKLKRERYLGLRTDLWLYFWATIITMLACGFWHGAAWTFVAWGAYQGLFMILERWFLLKIYKKLPRVLPVLITFLITLSGWVLFRAASFNHAWKYLVRMWSFHFQPDEFALTAKFITLLALAFAGSFFALIPGIEKGQMRLFQPKHSPLGHLGLTLAALVLFVISLSVITSGGFSPFIYFRF